MRLPDARLTLRQPAASATDTPVEWLAAPAQRGRAVEVRPQQWLTALCTPDPGLASRVTTANLPLGYRGAIGRGRPLALATLEQAFRTPSMTFALALRRCVFPCTGWLFEVESHGGDTGYREGVEFEWVAGLWGNGPDGPAGLVLVDAPAARCRTDCAPAGPMTLALRDLGWWLDTHLVDRARLHRLIAGR